MDSPEAIDSTAAASNVPHKRPTARTWYTILRGISFLLLLACMSLAIVAFVKPYHSSPSCFDGICSYDYYYSDSFPPIWQTVTVRITSCSQCSILFWQWPDRPRTSFLWLRAFSFAFWRKTHSSLSSLPWTHHCVWCCSVPILHRCTKHGINSLRLELGRWYGT